MISESVCRFILLNEGNKMKRNSIIAFVLSASIVFTACTGYKAAEMEDSKTSGNTISPSETAVETDVDFTEGIWIKKYPDNYDCFKFESPEGYQIVNDPYKINELLQPDIVIESHKDMDHADISKLEPPYRLITVPDEYYIDDVVIHGYAGKHNVGAYLDTNNIFVFSMNDITIALFGSQGELPSNEALEQIGTVDILLIQLFDNPDYKKLLMNDADIIIGKLSPKIIIPEHGDSTAGSQLAKHLNVTEEVEDTGNLIVTRDMLDEIEEIRVINLDNNNDE